MRLWEWKKGWLSGMICIFMTGNLIAGCGAPAADSASGTETSSVQQTDG